MIRRGEIYLVNLNPTKGREQTGRRPVLVVSCDAINKQPLVVTVVPGTDSANVPKDYPVNVRVKARDCGLPKNTVFLCFQLRSLDSSRFEERAGSLSPEKMQLVDEALRRTLAL